jgi:SAM-dependent methyltransferase
MPSGQTSKRPVFEDAWRRRFEEFATIRDDDAGIAGWSPLGLETRMRAFLRAWPGTRAGTLWLDAGCGAGTYTRYLAKQGLRVVGLDYSPVTAAKAKARDTETCMWGVADVTHLPLKSGCFDGVICFGVIQALAQSEGAISELTGRLRPGGELWVDALNKYCVANMWIRLSRWLRGKPRHLRYESPRRMKCLMEQAGLVDVQIHWIPIMPGRFSALQPAAESAVSGMLLRHIPGLGALLSHSCMLTGTKPSISS